MMRSVVGRYVATRSVLGHYVALRGDAERSRALWGVQYHKYHWITLILKNNSKHSQESSPASIIYDFDDSGFKISVCSSAYYCLL